MFLIELCGSESREGVALTETFNLKKVNRSFISRHTIIHRTKTYIIKSKNFYHISYMRKVYLN